MLISEQKGEETHKNRPEDAQIYTDSYTAGTPRRELFPLKGGRHIIT